YANIPSDKNVDDVIPASRHEAKSPSLTIHTRLRPDCCRRRGGARSQDPPSQGGARYTTRWRGFNQQVPCKMGCGTPHFIGRLSLLSRHPLRHNRAGRRASMRIWGSAWITPILHLTVSTRSIGQKRRATC